eukprot:scaffold5585_cov129-Cylindrotheca_fusiformis.AAC.1
MIIVLFCGNNDSSGRSTNATSTTTLSTVLSTGFLTNCPVFRLVGDLVERESSTRKLFGPGIRSPPTEQIKTDAHSTHPFQIEASQYYEENPFLIFWGVYCTAAIKCSKDCAVTCLYYFKRTRKELQQKGAARIL